MNNEQFIVKNVQSALQAQGCSAAIAAQDCLDHYRRTAKFARNAFDDCLEHAGKSAQRLDANFKFTKPRRRTVRRCKRPPEATLL